MRAGGQLEAFKSDAEFVAFLQKRREAIRRRNAANPPAPPPAAPMAAQESAKADSVTVTGSRASGDRITNTQEADVDEGGIVKKRGDLLVILRRGRLFTVSIAGGQMRPVDHINAFPPGVTGGGDWYDEMLISGDRVIVIGYSYARGGTEVNRFRLSPDRPAALRGRLSPPLQRLLFVAQLCLAADRQPAGLSTRRSISAGTTIRSPASRRSAAGRDDASRCSSRIAQARDVYIVPSHARRR